MPPVYCFESGVSRSASASAPASASAALMSASGAPLGATLSRSDSSNLMKSWNTAVIRDRHEPTSSSRRSTPSTSIAPDVGS
jgi:hypothetical protein